MNAERGAPEQGERVSLSEYARLRGCGKAAVHRALKAGILTAASSQMAGREWRIDPRAADAEWATRAQPMKQRGKAAARAKADRAQLQPPWPKAEPKGRRGKTGKAPAELGADDFAGFGEPLQAGKPLGIPEPPEEGDLAGVPAAELLELLVENRGDVAWASAIEIEIRARVRLVDLQRRQREVVEVSAVNRAIFNLGREAREKLLQIPDRMAGELAAITDPNQVAVRLEQAIVHALEELTAQRLAAELEGKRGLS